MKDNVIEVGKYTITETESEFIVKDGNDNIIGKCETESEAHAFALIMGAKVYIPCDNE